MSVPFHKQTDPNKQAGQVVFSIPKQELTLSDYIERKTGAITDCDIPKKITFYEWLKTTEAEEVDVDIADAAIIWIAALTKGKL